MQYVKQNNTSNPLREKSYTFALHIICFCKDLREKRKEFDMSRQLIRSGTSIGANIEEAIHAPSKKDFVNKLSIALKEAHESQYWLRLLCDSGYANTLVIESLLGELKELIALLTSIIKSSRMAL